MREATVESSVNIDIKGLMGDVAAGVADARSGLRVIVVDDSAAQRRLLSTILKREGIDVLQAGSAQAALDILDDTTPTVVLCDWLMPGMSGPEFCERVRAIPRHHYVYILILTSLQQDKAAAEALDYGADDFLQKPVKPHELRARLRAGIRVVEMQAQLLSQNRAVSSALSELSELYAGIERDLTSARLLQEALMPAPEYRFGSMQAGFLLRSAGKVGGDLAGFFPAGPDRLGVYAIDVSGHGVASALLSARIEGMFSRSGPDQGVAMGRGDDGEAVPRGADEIVRRINNRLMAELDTELYLTLALAVLDRNSGHVDLVQAGHPHPLLRRADGAMELVGNGGLPVGLVFDAEYEVTQLELSAGDQLFLQSDGFVECELPGGEMLGEDRLKDIFADVQPQGRPAEALAAMLRQLETRAGTNEFNDDVSGVLIEMLADPASA